MSMDLMVQAMKIRVGNPLRKLVLLKLADNRHYQRRSDLPGGLPWVAGNALPQRCC